MICCCLPCCIQQEQSSARLGFPCARAWESCPCVTGVMSPESAGSRVAACNVSAAVAPSLTWNNVDWCGWAGSGLSLPTHPRGTGLRCVVRPQPCTGQHSLIYKAEHSELSDGRLDVA